MLIRLLKVACWQRRGSCLTLVLSVSYENLQVNKQHLFLGFCFLCWRETNRWTTPQRRVSLIYITYTTSLNRWWALDHRNDYQNSQTHLTKQTKTMETKTNKNWNCICFINMRYPICLLPFYAMMCNNEGFPFHQFNITYYSWCLVPVWRLQKVAPYYIIV